ncbi:eukaryotic translation initiation factor 2-alpha kinase 1-like isoform X2 [Tachypleus tridentatus]|uniref:eukaryotic translation initiation factor 2-alpha kinase 1-like isoform X2 n=1 Tax=Tachypleus tridentatus TaxID=6853 RepID=UPI003FCEEAB3
MSAERNLQTLPASNEQAANSAVSVQNNPQALWIIECLLEVICQQQESDPVKRELLYTDLYNDLKDLISIEFQNSSSKSSIFDVILKSFEKNGYVHAVIQNGNLNKTESSLELIPSFSSLQLPSRTEYGDRRYANEFKEIEFIGSGTFGEVFKVQSHLDQTQYAIKKVYCRDFQLKELVQQEVRHFSRLSHPNVVNYKTSWVESGVSLQSFEDTSSENVSGLETDCDGASEDSLINFKESATFLKEEKDLKKKDYTVPPAEVCQTQEMQKLGSSNVISNFYPTPAERCFDLRYKDLHVKIKEMSRTQSSSSSELDENDYLSNNDEQLCGELIHSNVEDLLHYEKQNTRFNSNTYSDLLAPKHLQTLNMQPLTCHIQMELCGTRLKDYLTGRNNTEPKTGLQVFSKVNVDKVLKIFQQLLKGVDHIHSKGLIHRDLTPQNILFDIENKKVKIGDLGLSKMSSVTHGNTDCHDNISSHTPGVGTYLYCAPEQKEGSSYDFKVDMFSLGVVLLELLHPFATEMERVECLKKLQSGIVPSEVEQNWSELVIKELQKSNEEWLKINEQQKIMLEKQCREINSLFKLNNSLAKENQELHIQLQKKELELETFRNNFNS